MRKNSLITFFSIVLLYFNSLKVSAQHSGDSFLDIGIGLDMSDRYGSTFANNISPHINPNYVTFNATYNFSANWPLVYNASFDYGITNWFALGIGISYESFSGETTSNSAYYNQYTDQLSALNVRIRPIFHLPKTYLVNFYLAFPVGITFWNDVYNNPATHSYYYRPFFTQPKFQVLSIQALVGASYFVSHSVAIQAEAGLSFPYNAEIGLTFLLSRR